MYVHLGIGLCLTGPSKSPKWSELAIRKRRPSAGSSPQSPSAAVFCGQNVSLFQTFWLLRPSFDWSRPSQRTLLKSVQSGLWFTPANPFTASPRLVFEWFVGWGGGLRFVSLGEAMEKLSGKSILPQSASADTVGEAKAQDMTASV